MKSYRVSCGALLILPSLRYSGTQEKAHSAPARGYAQQKILIAMQQLVTE